VGFLAVAPGRGFQDFSGGEKVEFVGAVTAAMSAKKFCPNDPGGNM